jgi:23S rRNA pseudouridine955/2504/2580 synthase
MTASTATTPAGQGVQHVEATAGDAGQRLDNWLLRTLRGVPRSRIYRLLRKGEVRVNGRRAQPEQRLQAGDSIRLPPVRTATEQGAPRVPDSLIESIERCVLSQDRRLIVVNKPAGVAVHGGSGLSFGVIEALRTSRPQEELELVHRLDRDTSGCLLVARDRTTLRLLHALIRDGALEKRYLTLVKGNWPHGRKPIDAPLATQNREHGERVVRVKAEGKQSLTHFAPVEFYGSRATLLEADIATGRTHQIRVHAGFAGHPVAGDDKYGDREFNAAMREFGLTRMFLHAHSVSFEWPDSGNTFSASAPLPEDLAAVLDRLTAARRSSRGRTRRRPSR